MELAEELERLSTMTDRTERFKRLQYLSRELCRLQRGRSHALQLGLFQAKATQNSNQIPTNRNLLKPFET